MLQSVVCIVIMLSTNFFEAIIKKTILILPNKEVEFP